MRKIILMAATLALVLVMATAAIAAGGIVRHGGNGPDTITGTKYNDRLFGEGGPDTLRGRAGNDYLNGGDSGNDTCIGGKGKDRFVDCETIQR